MRRLTDTDGLTEFQHDILRTVRDFVDAEVLPVASELDHADVYPDGIVTRLKELGATNCSLAATGTPCRQVPDISANADEYTPYAEYCTGSAATVNSVCATIGSGGGWFGIGGTSLSSPLWAAVTADRDSYQGRRTGNINPLLYWWLITSPSKYFTDMTGQGPLQQAATNNGLFPTTPGYDEATGIGSPKFAAVITG
jgi:hypothetical protein